jgi:hypothetical protein
VDGDLISLVLKVAPSATDIIQRLLVYKSKPSATDINTVLLAELVERTNLSYKATAEACDAIRVLRSDFVRKGIL